jgi:hypothetical protein
MAAARYAVIRANRTGAWNLKGRFFRKLFSESQNQRWRDATFRAAELGWNGAESCLNRANHGAPVMPLLSPCSLPVMPELSPCYGPVPRAPALFDQPSENKWFSEDYRSSDRAETGRKRAITGRNRENRRVKQSDECRARKCRVANPSTPPKRWSGALGPASPRGPSFSGGVRGQGAYVSPAAELRRRAA